MHRAREGTVDTARSPTFFWAFPCLTVPTPYISFSACLLPLPVFLLRSTPSSVALSFWPLPLSILWPLPRSCQLCLSAPCSGPLLSFFAFLYSIYSVCFPLSPRTSLSSVIPHPLLVGCLPLLATPPLKEPLHFWHLPTSS